MLPNLVDTSPTIVTISSTFMLGNALIPFLYAIASILEVSSIIVKIVGPEVILT